MARRLPLVLSVALALAACGPARPAGNLDGAGVGGPFALVNQDGRPMTDREFTGQYRLMYFGYTYCPDVCPVDAAKLAAGLKAFEAAAPERGARVTPIFVTIDPARDTPAKLKDFTQALHPRFVGLTGPAAQVQAAKRAFKVYGERAPGGTADGYLMDHSNNIYLMGPDGTGIAFTAGSVATPDGVRQLLDKYVT